jgi:hypothetical protein
LRWICPSIGPRKRQRWVTIALVATGFSAVLAYVQLWQTRPLFHNTFGCSDHALLPRWIWQPPVVDSAGDYALADFRLNLFVVVAGMAPEHVQLYPYATVTAEHAVVAFSKEDRRLIEIPRRNDSVLIFLPDGSAADAALGPGMARSFYDAFRNESPRSLLVAMSERARNDDLARMLLECQVRVNSMAMESRRAATRPAGPASRPETEPRRTRLDGALRTETNAGRVGPIGAMWNVLRRENK